MITPRRTRLLRVPDLPAFQDTLIQLTTALSADEAANTFVLVPTRAAGAQLRRTVERQVVQAAALPWPLVGSRADWYDELARRLPVAPRILSGFKREVILAGIARSLAEEGLIPPFQIRPGLIAETLALYDFVRRLGRSTEDFDRNLRAELERDCETDRGAEKLLQQTVFLTALYRRYEALLADSGNDDEHSLRARLMDDEPSPPLQRVVITVSDRVADPDGLWPADFELLTRLPRLEYVDVVCTEGLLTAGVLERLHGVLPELVEQRTGSAARLPIMIVPKSRATEAPEIALRYRDREDEVSDVARRLKAERHSVGLRHTALIVRRPLPYLYLARAIFGSAGIAFETLDTLPLAAEPYVAALDLVLDAAASDFTRASVVALARSPHFQLGAEAVPAKSIAALDAALAESRYLGGFDRLDELAKAWGAITAPANRDERRRRAAASAAKTVVEALRPLLALTSAQPVVAQIEALLAWLRAFDRRPRADDATFARRLRVQGAVADALGALADAYRAHDPSATADVAALSATIRRWLGGQTFALATGEPGLQIVDAQAARFGSFDDVQLLGLIDGDWPERVRRNVLYPSSLLTQLEPLPLNPDPARRERDALNAARASFRDLLMLARERVRVSMFVLENDAVVEPSLLLDEVDAVPLQREAREVPRVRVFQAEALALDPPVPTALSEPAQSWAVARLGRDSDARAALRGQAGAWTLPRVSVSRLERYQDCPFRFFASEVLRLEEQPEDEDTRTPLERGRFLHELFEQFFSEWQRRGHRRIDPASVPEARALFSVICEQALATLSPAEATLERARLLGSAVSAGIAHRVFAMEAERPTDVVERLLEFPLQGDFRFTGADGRKRAVTLSAKSDRIDLLADGTMRVIDYKSKKTPELRIALQLPIYSHCARVSLEQQRGRRWTLGEAMYLSFEGEKAVVLFRAKSRTVDELIGDAEDRLLTTLDRIAAGHFPPQPSKRSLCGPCPYAVVCRLEYVEADE